MKITIYELLGLIKDGKAPKKIKYKELIIEYDEELFDYWCENLFTDTGYLLKGIFATDKNHLNDEVEILDEEDEFIDIEEITLKGEKISFGSMGSWLIDTTKNEEKIGSAIDSLVITINDLIKNQKKIINKLKEEGK